ncbi:MAG TPA: hypothetical protein VLK23_20565, partial [Thermodesulfobacteriota bacterium]|nr:hypothetical protein [Thermodesulfobacteriota bacterium]
CYKGDGKNAGCPMGLFPVSITSNQFCKMCGTCVRNCQYKSIHLDLRWPGAEIWENKEPNIVTSVAILALLGAVYPLILHHNHKIPGDSWFLFTLWFVSSVAFSLALFIGASFAKGRKSFRNIVSSYGFTYLPLAFAGHIAFQVPFMEEGLRWIAGSTMGGGSHESIPLLVQRFLIGVGSLWSLRILTKLFKREDWLITVAHGMLILFFAVLLLLALGV